SVQSAVEKLETSRLKRLLEQVGTCDLELAGTYRLDGYHISSALSSLDGRPGVTRDEMARLEFIFIRALDHSEHGIPNLERQVVESPRLFVQALALLFKRSDDGEDPPEWHLPTSSNREAVWSAAYALIEKIERIPGTDDDGTIQAGDLKAWVTEARSVCFQAVRGADIGDEKIGQILAAAPVGADGIWPCEPVREVLEDVASPEIAVGVAIGKYNDRGMHRSTQGADERVLASEYRTWARQLAFEYP